MDSTARPYSDRTLGVLLAWCAVALMTAPLVLLPSRTLQLAPAFWKSIAPGIVYGSMAGAANAGAVVGPWWGSALPHVWWAAGVAVLWFAVPYAILRREETLPFSMLPPRTLRTVAPYAVLLLLMLPVVVLVSSRQDFLQRYPMLHPAQANQWRWALLLLFWLTYAIVLFCTEFFFRGVLLFALESRLGVHAVAVSVLPYCLVHVGKPMPEALGSIVAGYVLGYYALKTRSIGGGLVVHLGVALAMDLLALSRTAAFPVGF